MQIRNKTGNVALTATCSTNRRLPELVWSLDNGF
jgi:hypothetical protein